MMGIRRLVDPDGLHRLDENSISDISVPELVVGFGFCVRIELVEPALRSVLRDPFDFGDLLDRSTRQFDRGGNPVLAEQISHVRPDPIDRREIIDLVWIDKPIRPGLINLTP